MPEPIPTHPNPSRPDWEVLLSPSQSPLGDGLQHTTPAPGQPIPPQPGTGTGTSRKELR